MKKTVALLAAAAALAASAGTAHAQEAVYAPPPPPPFGARPSTGLGLIVTGSVFTAIGGVNLLTSPICKTDLIAKDTQTLCLGASLGVGVAFLAVGIPMLAVGVSRRNAYVEWKRAGGVARLLDLDVKPAHGGGLLTWHAAF